MKLANLVLLITLLVFLQTWGQDSPKDLAIRTSGMDLSMVELSEYAKSHFSDDYDKAKFFYHWINQNIEYEYEVLERHKNGIYTEEDNLYNTTPTIIFNRKKAVCQGYSELYKWFMESLDIETVIIDGYVRHFTNPYVEPESDAGFSHAWNAVKIGGEWLVVDTTWANQFVSNVPDYYFDIRPEKAIITHFPNDSDWQLLDKPLTLDEFNDSQYVDPLWFLTGFEDKPSLKEDENYYYFVYKQNPNRNWLVRLGFGTDSINYEPVPGIRVINQDGYTYYRFPKKQIPDNAAFKVDLNDFNEEKQTMMLYENIILFKI
ncbi:hypothetical protein GTQ34_16195 [Muricauda sp. JGD-17]|uniref:Transglutaminase-like domain-containing protein n=1 Tax=Flagellimonas ochracea TaxID=2696472 RepID=A0A964TFN2_9FLAO|nr:transglutaminase domain-containing protein [Allomuricauda ochracea]NAY93453.1 hypothetical protein [Allomuricauda ochracea]